MKTRDLSIDIAKGIGILSVILGHCNFTPVSAFHMPLFLILSGIYFSPKNDFSTFVKNRVRRLLVPYVFGVFLTIIGSICKNLIVGSNIHQIVSDVYKWTLAGLYGKGTKGEIIIPGISKIGAYWFLLSVFYGSVIVRRFINHKYLLSITALIAYIGYSTRQLLFLPFSIQNGMVSSFFIALGVYCKRYDLLNKKPDPYLIVCLVLLSVFAFTNNITLSMVNLRFPYGLLNIIVACCISYLIVFISQNIERHSKILSICISYFGQNSLIILFYHAFEINILRWNWLEKILITLGIENVYLIMLAEFTARTLFVLICTLITNHFKILKKIFS